MPSLLAGKVCHTRQHLADLAGLDGLTCEAYIATKEIRQLCLVFLHLISLVRLRYRMRQAAAPRRPRGAGRPRRPRTAPSSPLGTAAGCVRLQFGCLCVHTRTQSDTPAPTHTAADCTRLQTSQPVCHVNTRRHTETHGDTHTHKLGHAVTHSHTHALTQMCRHTSAPTHSRAHTRSPFNGPSGTAASWSQSASVLRIGLGREQLSHHHRATKEMIQPCPVSTSISSLWVRLRCTLARAA